MQLFRLTTLHPLHALWTFAADMARFWPSSWSCPAARGILFDQAHVVSSAAELLAWMIAVEIVAGSFFEAVPEGGDAYVLKEIVHDSMMPLPSRHSAGLPRRDRMGGKLLVVERLIAPPNEAPDAKFSDLDMIVSPGGQDAPARNSLHFRGRGFQLSTVVATTTRAERDRGRSHRKGQFRKS